MVDTKPRVYKSRVILPGTDVAIDFSAYERPGDYLRIHQIGSYYYARPDAAVERELFTQILGSLLSQEDIAQIEGEPFWLHLHVAQPHNAKGISPSEVQGLSVETFANDGYMHSFFRGDGDRLRRIPKLDTKSTVLYHWGELTWLHFAGLRAIPPVSGIIVVRRQLSDEQRAIIKTWQGASRTNNHVKDMIYSDPDLNIGVAMLDNDGGPGETCGADCPVATSHSICMHDENGRPYCQPITKDGCFGHTATQVAVRAGATFGGVRFAVDLPKVRKFDQEYLPTTEIGRRYLEFIPVLDKYLRFDLKSLGYYLQVAPDLYRLIDVLSDDKVDENAPVITDKIFEMGMNFLKEYEHIEEYAFQAMTSRVRADLMATKGMNKGQFTDWFGLLR